MIWLVRLFSSFGKIPLYLSIGAFVIGLLTTVYFGWKRQVEQQALLEFNQRQLEQVIRDQQQFVEKMRRVEQSQKEIEGELAKQNAEVDNALKNIDAYLLSPEARGADRPSSLVLKNTVNQLRKVLK
jgi:uncharacterized protein HemX